MGSTRRRRTLWQESDQSLWDALTDSLARLEAAGTGGMEPLARSRHVSRARAAALELRQRGHQSPLLPESGAVCPRCGSPWRE
jgi:hypothetical protein